MKNLSLNAKILVIIAVLIAGGGIISYFSLTKMSDINEKIEEITKVHVKRDQLSASILDATRRNNILNKNIAIEPLPEKQAELEKQLVEVREVISKTAEEAKKISSPEGVKLIEQYLETFENLRTITAEVRTLGKARKMDELAVVVREKEIPMVSNVNKILGNLNDLTAKDLANAEKEAENAYTGARSIVFLTIIIALVAGLTLAALTLRAISTAINQVISNLTDNSNNVSAAAQQIAASSEELSQAVSEQAASLQETSASVEEMSSMITRNAEGAKRSRDVAGSSSDAATRGKDTVEEMISAMAAIDDANSNIMGQITESNQKIGEIVTVIGEISNKTKVINDIVFQTKLLSFNASVEAARAGDHGKGFAVVAEEVGNLAQMSGNAAKEISTMLESSMHRVESIVAETKTKVEHMIKQGREKVEVGSNVAKECGRVLDDIVKSIGSVNSLSSEIANASEEQARGITEISKAMTQMDQVTQQNAAVSTQAAGAAESLSSQAEGLRHVVQLLVATVKGGSGNTADVIASAVSAPTTTMQKKPAKVLSMTRKHAGKSSSGKTGVDAGRKVVGGDIVPSEHDSRFEDV